MVISDFFHLRLGAPVGGGGDQQHSYSLKVFIVFVALGLPFPQVHLSVGGEGGGGSTGFQFKYIANTSCGISTGPASYFIFLKKMTAL